MKLRDIWISQDIQQYIKDTFNSIITPFPNIKTMDETESIALETMLKNYCHVLLVQDLKYTDENIDLAKIMLNTSIVHNIIQLTNEFRSTMTAFDWKKSGRDVMQVATQPLDSTDDQATSINYQENRFNEFDNMVKAMSYMQNNSQFIKDIYNEIKSLVMMIYGVL